MKYYYYRRPRTSIEEIRRNEVFKSEGFKKWLDEKFKEQEIGERVSNCCCEKLIGETERCGKCKENCKPIYIQM